MQRVKKLSRTDTEMLKIIKQKRGKENERKGPEKMPANHWGERKGACFCKTEVKKKKTSKKSKFCCSRDSRV